MMTRFLHVSLIVLAFGTIGSGCRSSGSSDCPPIVVSLDATVDGLPDVGENGSTAICHEICGENAYSCCRTKELVVTCVPFCK